MGDELLLLQFDLDLRLVQTLGREVKRVLESVQGDASALTVDWVGLDQLDRVFSQFPASLKGGVKLSGPATAYGLVWEWGRADIKPGPKTLWSANPAGDRAVLTIQAPHGWIRVNTTEYIEFLRDEWRALDLNMARSSIWVESLKDMLWDAASRCARLMEDTAPVDTGQLRSGIIAVNEPDPILETGSANEYGPTELSLLGWM